MKRLISGLVVCIIGAVASQPLCAGENWQVRDEELPKLKDWMGQIVNHPIDTNQVLVADPPKDMALFLLVGQSNMAATLSVLEDIGKVE